jgi:DNA-binding transcriptional LysR family regulator
MHAWDDWQIFLATATARSMSRSARSMNLDQSTVSRRLAALEVRLGTKLFLRSRRGLELTPAAARLLPVITRAGAAFEEAERMLTWSDGPPRGTVRVATIEAVANYMLVPALPSLVAQHPQVQLELLPDAALVDLAARESDVALRLIPPGDSEFIARPIDAGPLRAYVSSRTRPRSAGTAPADVRWIGWDDARSSQPEYRWMAAHRVPVVFRSSRATTMIEAALAGLGAVLLPARFGERISGLKRIEVDRLPSDSVTLWLVTSRALRSEPVIECVWNWLLELFGGRPDVRDHAPPRKDARAARRAPP